ncbi:DUF3029 family protein, partial [Salmonella enterica subsp. enterica serovar Anatum]|nr:DUF3029 family protein [Salmonella enterica subsp. enterica serovar Anatum]
KAGMREFTANVSGNDLVRVTGYMVRLSDLAKFRAEGSRTNTTPHNADMKISSCCHYHSMLIYVILCFVM